MPSESKELTPPDTVEEPGDQAQEPPIVVGVGGSAGGLPALMGLLESVGADAQFAMVVVLHLAPDQESHAAEILQGVTPMVVVQVRQRTLLEPGHVYVIAPGTDLITDDGHVQPSAGTNKRPSSVIDLFFRTLGTVHRERAVGIVLSGTGKDGALGLAQIKECGGLTLAQQPEDCEHGDMPQAAIDTGTVDLILPAMEIGRRLIDLAALPRAPSTLEAGGKSDPQAGNAGLEDSPERAFQEVLNALRVRTRHDFRNYKRATITRRLDRRIRVIGVTTVQEYRDYVRQHPEELALLLADLLISVTHFFRDAPAFEALETQVVPELINSVDATDSVRVWVPACASGEESYSVAILMQEYADRIGKQVQIQVFASDINEAALSVARAGVYPSNIATDISEGRLLSFFDNEDGNYFRVRRALRETVVFAQHNVLSDPPFSRVDLICCRNLLIYLDRAAQAAVMEMFAFALKPGGYLFLGTAESVDALSNAFEPVSKEQRIYRLRPESVYSTRARVPPNIDNEAAPLVSAPAPAPRDPFALREQPVAALHERALVAASPPSVLIDADYELERVSAGAGRFVAFGAGLPSRNLLNNVAADIRMELRAALLRASESQQPIYTVFLRQGENGADTGPVMTLSVHPIRSEDNPAVHWLVLFDERLSGSASTDEPEEGGHTPCYSAIERLEEENRSLKGHLQTTLDSSAVNTEELRASNEELQAINEELRSAKEELETSKEELQSLNEELTTVNFELRIKVDEAGRNNDDLRNLIEASEIATVFVDSAMCVKRFTPQATKLFALIPTDVGRPLMDVKSRLNYDEIVEDATSVFRHLRPIERAITTTAGGHFLARILPYRTSTDKIGGAVLTFVDVSELRLAERRVVQTEERLRDAVAASKDFAVVSTDARGLITAWNEGARRIFGYETEEAIGQAMEMLFTPEDRAAGVPESERRQARRDGRAADERWHLRKDGTRFFCSGVTTPMQSGDEIGFLKIARDTSEGKGRELQQSADLSKEQHSTSEARSASEAKDRFLAVMSHELKQPLNLIHVNAELLVRLPDMRESAAVQRIGGTILRAVTAQETIVNDLLDLSRVQTGKLRLHPEAIDLGQLIRQLGDAIGQDAARKKIELEIQTPVQELVCKCDRVRIEQVIWNLLGNAIKFTPENGKVSLKVMVEGKSAKVEVTDSGIGISAQALPTIFELFSQADGADPSVRDRGGLGIGLALVRELVQAHGGRIEAASNGAKQGATFTVWIPLAPRNRTESTSGPGAISLARRVLMVDDDVDSLETFADLLRLEGATVDSTVSAKQALKMLAAGDYEVLLSDIGMDEMSGLEFMKLARELRPTKQFFSVAISGYGRDVDVMAAQDAGFDAHLSKPISLDRLKSVFKDL